MATIDEMEEEMDFVNWDEAAPPSGVDLHMPSCSSAGLLGNPLDLVDASGDPNMDLVFGNVDGDDYSFWALEHFEATHMATDIDVSAMVEPPLSQMTWATPDAPCGHCAQGNYQCKLIQEGKYKGYCTSCVALRCECSFGPLVNNLTAEAGATFPANPWPIMGDRPATSILLEDDLSAIANPSDKKTSPRPQDMPKIGARFSRESVKILKNWVSTHSRHPYPTEDEKECLQTLTGLSKVQITNWLANARRRGKIHTTRATSPHVGRGYAQAIDIPQRRGTPGLSDMNPLQRWANSPPENEPASVTAIAQAVSDSSALSQTSGSGRTSPWISNCSDDGSARSICNQSSASSLGTSHSSGGSFASAFSQRSNGSFGSIPSFVRSNRGRRRRRRAQPKAADEVLSQPLKTFQCTFCTETFRTKHDWQRHEKSLHLSLERWVCSPDGPTVVNPESGLVSCVFCGDPNPDESHIESHNFAGCTERNQEERTFYRKDHLRQHLKLVHNVKFLGWTMDKWRVNSPEIRSRCGFCGIVMDNWTMRIDHLAEHFKTGNTMADWKGDWGFEAPVLEMVENSIPPYLIHDERKSPLPYMASNNSPATPSNAYELVKLEIQYWISCYTEDNGRAPTNAEIQQEACGIIFGADMEAKKLSRTAGSWLRDLIVSSEDVTRQAMFSSVRVQAKNRMSSLSINGKAEIFDDCQLEDELLAFVRSKRILGLTALDHELQLESCRIIGRLEEKSCRPCEEFANLLVSLINSSPKWLEKFRQRACLPRSEDMVDEDTRSKDPKTIDSTIHNYTRLERELGEFLRSQRALGVEPDDAALQRQARIIIYDIDDEWNQTAADDKLWLSQLRLRHPAEGTASMSTAGSSPTTLNTGVGQLSALSQATRDSEYVGALPGNVTSMAGVPDHASDVRTLGPGPYFMNDANCYRRLFRGLRRFVTSTMSSNNPNHHIPTDKEIQHQARWLVYDDDDPWNQTAADNAEWLQRFKRDVGLLPADSGPGLAPESLSWTAPGGGTGFAPPYIYPNPAAVIKPVEEAPLTSFHPSPKCSEPSLETTNRYLQNFTQRYAPPAKIFCSRELEHGLNEFVKRQMTQSGIFPSDDSLRQRARDIMGMQKTSCDDEILLGKFKASMQNGSMLESSPSASSSSGTVSGAIGDSIIDPLLSLNVNAATMMSSAVTPSSFDLSGGVTMSMDADIDFSFTEQEMSDILQEISPTFSGSNSSPSGSAQPQLQQSQTNSPLSMLGGTGAAGSGSLY